MADLSEVEEALVGLVASALYPNGPSAVPANGALTRVYRGWPMASSLDADLAAGYVNVTVFSESGGRNTTRHLDQWLRLPAPGVSLIASVTGNAVTFSGSALVGQLAGVLADGTSYVHATDGHDSPALVASDLATLMRADRIVLLSGASIIVPGVSKLTARVVALQPAMMVTRRQEQHFRVTCWSPDPALRDRTAVIVDTALAPLAFIPLPDGSAGRIRYHSGAVNDNAEDATLYRRDLVYSVEYPTTVKAQMPTMLFGDLAMQAPAGPPTNLTV